MWLTSEMVNLKFIILALVFQVSSSSSPSSSASSEVFKFFNATTGLSDELSDNDVSYRIVASSAEYLFSFLTPFEDDDEPSSSSANSDTPWYAKESFDAEEDVSFYLYTKSGSDDPREELRLNNVKSLKRSRFNASNPTRVIIHGWLGSEFAGVFFSLTPAYLRKGNYNVILVDWGRGAIADYASASRRVKSVGVGLAKFIDFLHRETGMPFKNLYLIGFSMGAHIAGIAGKCVTTGRIPVIFGLDPALPRFRFEDTDRRLTSNDADYVEVIHTNAGGYGYEKALGHADFYVNYGDDQPGCFIAECSHMRAFRVFAESLKSKAGFWAKGCDPKDVFNLLRKRKCFKPTSVLALLGGDSAEKRLSGVFYVTTNSDSPFAKGRPKYL